MMQIYSLAFTKGQVMLEVCVMMQGTTKLVSNLADRHKTHLDTVKFCEDVLRRKPLEWRIVSGKELNVPISDVNLVITIGGDGTLLRASHHMDSFASIFGVNSAPVRNTEVKGNLKSFGVRGSTGFLCAATADNFEQILDEILEERRKPVQLSRIGISIDGVQYHTYALNDVLLVHPSPAAVTHCSFRIIKEDCYDNDFPPVYCRSSGLRVCTAAGSTAAMRSAGGYPMPILSRDLQYMVREPILLHDQQKIMHGWIRTNEVMHIVWSCMQGFIYIDGSHDCLPLKYGSTVHISSKAPPLQVYLNIPPAT